MGNDSWRKRLGGGGGKIIQQTPRHKLQEEKFKRLVEKENRGKSEQAEAEGKVRGREQNKEYHNRQPISE